ncbi:DUF2339 domain-containing protein [Paenibacillus sp. JDR-2]|uniref:DUF2339 domain-containing protein n=1 Tax=Paenibacillus sp. (strain JDR-2) TaxID=324057 RepID=UPI000166AB38|nr:DUF2339 domain-containing protein [Paenibacillus sp. JDR-2]ACT04797.1 membrane protein-like protein [Paenibacillus sp. JDR-2]
MELDDRVSRLEARITELEKEITELKESKQSLYKPYVPPVLPKNSPRAPYTPVGHSAAQKQEIKKEKPDWEHLIARVWLPRIFLFVLLIGIIWGFKAAVDGGFLTETMRCILGYVACGAFIFVGFRQQKAKRPLLAQVLFGGSIGIGMLTTFAAHGLYELMNVPVAFILNIVFVVLGVLFSHNLRSQALAMLASAAGVLTPFLLNSDHPSVIFFVVYEALLFVSFMVFALGRKYAALFYQSFVLLQIAFAIYELIADGNEKIVALGILAQQLVLLLSIFAKTPLIRHQLRLLVSSFALTALWFKLSYSELAFNVAMLAFFAMYALIAFWFLKKQKEESKDKVPYALTVASYALLFSLANFLPAESVPVVLLIEGVAALWLGFVVKSLTQQINGIVIYLIGCILGLDTVMGFMDSIVSMATLIWIVLLVTLGCLIKMVSRFGVGRSTKEALLVLWYGIGLALLTFLTEVTNVLTKDLNTNAQHLLVSAVWVVYSVAVIGYGLKKQIKKARLTGLALLFLTLMKVIFMDLPSVSLLAKAVLFMGLGFIGILLSRFFYNKKD